MKIQKVEAAKKQMFIVHLSDGQKFRAHEESVVRYRLISGRELDEGELDEIMEGISYDEAYIKALKYISYKLRSKYEVEQYLLDGDFMEQVAAHTVDRLMQEGYIDDKRYAEALKNTMLNTTLKGPGLLQRELKKHRLNQFLIDEAVRDFDDSIDAERMNKIKDKELKKYKGAYRQFQMKLKEKMMVKGYMNHHFELIDFNDDFDDTSFFEKDFEKYYDKYRTRESGWKLKSKLIQSLLRKGYNYQLIEEKIGGIEDEIFEHDD